MDRAQLKDEVFMNMAKEISRLGTCLRMQAGCLLLTLEGRVAGAGYNGAGPGMNHCHPDTCNSASRCLRCAHAETNALSNRSGNPYVAYITHSPCLNCFRELALAGVRKIVYEKEYTSMPENEVRTQLEWMHFYGIKMEKI